MTGNSFLLTLLCVAVPVLWGCEGPSDPPKRGGGAQPPADAPAGKASPAELLTAEKGVEDPGLTAAEAAVKGPAGPYPASAVEGVRESLSTISRLQEHTVKALVKTPAALKAKGLLDSAEEQEVSRDVSIVLMMNGWTSPERWRESRGQAKRVLEALEALQKVEADPARADRADLIARANELVKAAEVSQDDINTVHKYQKDLTDAFALK